MLEALTFCPLGDVLHEASEARTKPRASPSPCSILAHAHRSDAESGAVERALMHVQTGFLRTIITESPRKNILLIKRSLLIGFAFALPCMRCHPSVSRLASRGPAHHAAGVYCASVTPHAQSIRTQTHRNMNMNTLPVRGASVHISLTFSSTMLQCRSNACNRTEAPWYTRAHTHTHKHAQREREREIHNAEIYNAQSRLTQVALHAFPRWASLS